MSRNPRGAPGTEPTLSVLNGPNAGKEYPIGQGVTIGRTQDNEVVLADRSASRQHARVAIEAGIFTLTDLGSANGTLLNDRKISGVEVLRDGDQISIGSTSVLFRCPEAFAIAAEPTRVGLAAAPAAAGAKTARPGARRLPLDKRRRMMVFGGAGAIGLILIVLVTRTVAPAGPDDLSDEPIPYARTEEFFTSTFGYGDIEGADQSHPDKVRFRFTYLRGRATLFYSIYGASRPGEVAVFVNDRRVGDVPASSGGWRYMLEMDLPRDAMRIGQENELVFDNTRTPAEERAWLVTYVRIEQAPLLASDFEGARTEYARARRFYDERGVEPSNLYTAMIGFRRVRDRLELATPAPEMYLDAVRMIRTINDDLNDVFTKGTFSAQRESRFDRVAEARQYLSATLRYFPRNIEIEDPRRIELQNYLERLSEE